MTRAMAVATVCFLTGPRLPASNKAETAPPAAQSNTTLGASNLLRPARTKRQPNSHLCSWRCNSRDVVHGGDAGEVNHRRHGEGHCGLKTPRPPRLSRVMVRGGGDSAHEGAKPVDGNYHQRGLRR